MLVRERGANFGTVIELILAPTRRCGYHDDRAGLLVVEALHDVLVEPGIDPLTLYVRCRIGSPYVSAPKSLAQMPVHNAAISGIFNRYAALLEIEGANRHLLSWRNLLACGCRHPSTDQSSRRATHFSRPPYRLGCGEFRGTKGSVARYSCSESSHRERPGDAS